MPCVCICACGKRWTVPQDLATYAGELSLACPSCAGGAIRLLLGPVEAVTTPPGDQVGVATTPPRFSTEDAVEPDLIDDEPAGGLRNYLVIEELGRGGMGVVYKARQKGLNRLVALKMILAGTHAGPEEVSRFRVEAEAIARLQHPNVVQVYEVGVQSGLPFFSLEYCDGGSLERRLRGKPMAPREAAAVVEVLAQAMQAAHDRGIVHRDLKPGNVLLSRRASCQLAPAQEQAGSLLYDEELKITDFGLAKKLDEQEKGRTRTGAVMGTPSYMAPEQAEGRRDVGPPADVYALGAILYECLTGRPPFQAATSLDTIMQVISEEPVRPRLLNSRVPRDLEVLCLKCLQKDPKVRLSSAAELAAELRRYLDGDPIRTRPPGIVRRTWKTLRKRPVYAVFVLLLSSAILLGVWDYVRSADPFKGFGLDEASRILDLLRSDKDAVKQPVVTPAPPKQ